MVFRLFSLIVFLACLAISAFYRHRARRQSGTIARRREGGPLVALRIAVTLPLFVGVLLTLVYPPAVTHGPYRWVRHPLYTTGIALLLAIGLMTASAFILAFVVLVVVLILAVVIPREERALVEKFGEAYERYRVRTGRLLPRPYPSIQLR